jgi:hypothetical protein
MAHALRTPRALRRGSSGGGLGRERKKRIRIDVARSRLLSQVVHDFARTTNGQGPRKWSQRRVLQQTLHRGEHAQYRRRIDAFVGHCEGAHPTRE